MAIYRLTDIVNIFETKWIYGDSKFEYDFEVNQDHDIQYPLLQIEPPSSIIPEIYNGREEYEFELNFYNLYSQSAQSVVELQQRWDNLQDLSLEWLDMVLKHYQDSSVEAYLNDETIEIERVKEVANDRLVQIKLTFTISGFTKCFRPQSFYPSDSADLRMWLRADSVGTFNIPTKEITSWTERSGEGFNGSQSVSSKKPLRIGYDGAKDKSYVDFNGTSQYMAIPQGILTTNTTTMFFVFKQDASSSSNETVFSIDGSLSEVLQVYCDEGVLNVKALDSAGVGGSLSGGTSTNWNIIEVRIKNKNLYVTINGGTEQSLMLGASYATPIFEGNASIGALNDNSGVDITEYFNGRIAEAIAYERALNPEERTDIVNYLNTKYNIY